VWGALGWCSPFIGVGEATGRQQRAVITRVMALMPLITEASLRGVTEGF
jgi:hypothetical protein